MLTPRPRSARPRVGGDDHDRSATIATVLVVDDDSHVINLVRDHLTREGYRVVSASDGDTALMIAASIKLDLILLDIALREEDGRELFPELRLITSAPVVFLTGRGLDFERIDGLRQGADDYVVKPFSLRELSTRIEAILRRIDVNATRRPAEGPLLRYGDLVIDGGSHEVRVAGEPVALTSKEFTLLVFLASSPRQVFSRDELLRHVWPASGVQRSQKVVTEVVRRIRLKIEPLPSEPRWILTVPNSGYRFTPNDDVAGTVQGLPDRGHVDFTPPH